MSNYLVYLLKHRIYFILFDPFPIGGLSHLNTNKLSHYVHILMGVNNHRDLSVCHTQTANSVYTKMKVE